MQVAFSRYTFLLFLAYKPWTIFSFFIIVSLWYNRNIKIGICEGTDIMKVTIEELEAYLLDHYSNGGIDQSLFMKLVEEIGEVAEVLNKKAGRKKIW